MTMTVKMWPVDSIKVTDRVRDTVGDLRELIDSMRDRGLINPVTIQADGTLIAGERRLTAARELGWSEIACHVWQDETAGELLAIEIEENTARTPLTPVEAERARRRYQDLLRPLVPRPGGDRKSESFRTTDGMISTGSELRDLASKAVGYGRPTLDRVQEIRETAEDETQPEPVREVAAQEYANLATATKGQHGNNPVAALERVRLAKRQATRDAMSPGQWLKSDEPKAQPKTVTWSDRLWKVIPAGLAIKATAEELELDPDASSLSDKDITSLAELLMEQIRDRQHLRQVLLGIKKGRK